MGRTCTYSAIWPDLEHHLELANRQAAARAGETTAQCPAWGSELELTDGCGAGKRRWDRGRRERARYRGVYRRWNVVDGGADRTPKRAAPVVLQELRRSDVERLGGIHPLTPCRCSAPPTALCSPPLRSPLLHSPPLLSPSLYPPPAARCLDRVRTRRGRRRDGDGDNTRGQGRGFSFRQKVNYSRG
jgi:hypothetical protein